jgi:hypothetical protein
MKIDEKFGSQAISIGDETSEMAPTISRASKAYRKYGSKQQDKHA